MNIGGRGSYQKSEDDGDRDSVGKNQTKNKAKRENQKGKNNLGIESQKGEDKENAKLKKEKKKSGKETMGNEQKTQKNWDRKGYNRKMLDPDLRSLRNFAMRHAAGEIGGRSAECRVGTELFSSCSDADFCIQLPALL